MTKVLVLLFLILLPVAAHAAEPLPVPTGEDNPLKTPQDLEFMRVMLVFYGQCEKQGLKPDTQAHQDCVLRKMREARGKER